MKYSVQTTLFFVAITAILSCSPRQQKEADQQVTQSPDWEMGVALYSFNKFSFVEALEKAERAGAKSVEGFFFHQMGEEFDNKSMGQLSTEGIQQMKDLLDQKGIKMKSMYVGGAENEAGWRKFFDMGKQLEMEYLVGEPERKDLDLVDQLAGEYGIKFALHQHSREAGSIYWHPDSVLSAAKDRPNIGACGDLGHWTRSGLDAVECLKQLDGHLLEIHLKDIDDPSPDANDVLVGTGVVDFEAVVLELRRQKFDGLVYVECEHQMEDNLADVTDAIIYFQKLATQSWN